MRSSLGGGWQRPAAPRVLNSVQHHAGQPPAEAVLGTLAGGVGAQVDVQQRAGQLAAGNGAHLQARSQRRHDDATIAPAAATTDAGPPTCFPSIVVVSLVPEAQKVICSPLRKGAPSNWRLKRCSASSSPACLQPEPNGAEGLEVGYKRQVEGPGVAGWRTCFSGGSSRSSSASKKGRCLTMPLVMTMRRVFSMPSWLTSSAADKRVQSEPGHHEGRKEAAQAAAAAFPKRKAAALAHHQTASGPLPGWPGRRP